MAFHLDPAMERYIVSHSCGYGPAGEALVQATASLGEAADMMLGKEQYALFRFLAGLLGCRRILDVGTFTGLSALAFAEGMGAEGRVLTIDRNRTWIDMARKYWDMAGVGARIEARMGEALPELQALARTPHAAFDIVFLDVDKARIQDYFELGLACLAPRGLLMVDNALWHRWVLDPARVDADTEGMRRFNARLAADPRVEASMLPVADGLTLVRRKI
jgi:caffeoyl-CoA O-methyltransferase